MGFNFTDGAINLPFDSSDVVQTTFEKFRPGLFKRPEVQEPSIEAVRYHDFIKSALIRVCEFPFRAAFGVSEFDG